MLELHERLKSSICFCGCGLETGLCLKTAPFHHSWAETDGWDVTVGYADAVALGRSLVAFPAVFDRAQSSLSYGIVVWPSRTKLYVPQHALESPEEHIARAPSHAAHRGLSIQLIADMLLVLYRDCTDWLRHGTLEKSS